MMRPTALSILLLLGPIDTQNSLAGHCMIKEGVQGLSRDPIQGHLQVLPAGRTVSEVVGMHGL